MINWIYTWYNPRIDGNAKELSREMSELFLRGADSEGKSVSFRAVRSRRRGGVRDLKFATADRHSAKQVLKRRGLNRATKG
jgi:hypothetical protein